MHICIQVVWALSLAWAMALTILEPVHVNVILITLENARVKNNWWSAYTQRITDKISYKCKSHDFKQFKLVSLTQMFVTL